MNLRNRIVLGDGYRELLGDHKPEYFITLTYAHRFTDKECEGGMKSFFFMLWNSFPCRIKNRINGIIVAERHTKGEFKGIYHFHLLLWGIDEFMSDGLKWLKPKAAGISKKLYQRPPGPRCDCGQKGKFKALRTCPSGLGCRGLQMSDPSKVDVQRITSTPERVNAYVLKDIHRLSRPAGSQLLFFGPGGVVGDLHTRESMWADTISY